MLVRRLSHGRFEVEVVRWDWIWFTHHEPKTLIVRDYALAHWKKFGAHPTQLPSPPFKLVLLRTGPGAPWWSPEMGLVELYVGSFQRLYAVADEAVRRALPYFKQHRGRRVWRDADATLVADVLAPDDNQPLVRVA